MRQPACQLVSRVLSGEKWENSPKSTQQRVNLIPVVSYLYFPQLYFLSFTAFSPPECLHHEDHECQHSCQHQCQHEDQNHNCHHQDHQRHHDCHHNCEHQCQDEPPDEELLVGESLRNTQVQTVALNQTSSWKQVCISSFAASVLFIILLHIYFFFFCICIFCALKICLFTCIWWGSSLHGWMEAVLQSVKI